MKPKRKPALPEPLNAHQLVAILHSCRDLQVSVTLPHEDVRTLAAYIAELEART